MPKNDNSGCVEEAKIGGIAPRSRFKSQRPHFKDWKISLDKIILTGKLASKSHRALTQNGLNPSGCPGKFAKGFTNFLQ